MGEVSRVIAGVRPPSWDVRFRDGQDLFPEGRVELDGLLDLVSPEGVVTFAVEAKVGRHASSTMLSQVLMSDASSLPVPLLFVTDCINPVLRERLTEMGISFADATGWVRLVSDSPLVMISAQGADRSPKLSRTSTATTRLNGTAAGRIIRALLQEPVPLGVRELAILTGISPGSVSKLLPTLVAEGAIDRDATGSVVTVQRRVLLRRWTADYSFLNSNGVVFDYIAPRGIDRVLDALRRRDDAVVTGSVAARTFLPPTVTSVVPVTQVALYTADPQELAAELQLIRAERRTSNVVLTIPKDSSILALPYRTDNGLPTQVLADLLTLPGRSDQEAEQLMDALARRDPAWKE